MTSQRIQDMSTQAGQTIWGKLMDNPFVAFLIKFGIASVVVLFLIFLSKVISSTVRKKIVNRIILQDEEYVIKVGKLIEDIIFYSLSLFSLLLGFDIVGLDVGLFLGGFSIGIGFAFKELLGNMIAGIMILTTKDYNLGDIIEIEVNGEKLLGRIEEITIRYIVLRLFNLRRVIIPNIVFITTPVKTLSTEDIVRLETNISVHYDTDLNKVIDIIKSTLESLPFLIEKDNIKVFVDSFADSGINIKVLFFYDPNKGYSGAEVISKVNQAIFDAFKQSGIVIPYPHTVLTVDKNDKNLLSTGLFFIKNVIKGDS